MPMRRVRWTCSSCVRTKSRFVKHRRRSRHKSINRCRPTQLYTRVSKAGVMTCTPTKHDSIVDVLEDWLQAFASVEGRGRREGMQAMEHSFTLQCAGRHKTRPLRVSMNPQKEGRLPSQTGQRARGHSLCRTARERDRGKKANRQRRASKGCMRERTSADRVIEQTEKEDL